MADIQFRTITSTLTLLCLRTAWRSLPPWKALRNRQGLAVLDVGCGRRGFLTRVIRAEGWDAIGLDIHEPTLRQTLEHRAYREVVAGDAAHLPFEDRSFDLVTMIEVLEHLDRKGGDLALREAERVSRDLVVLTTPICPSEHRDYCGNPYEAHRYIWSPQELRAMGFTLRGKGLRHMTGDRWWSRRTLFLRPLQYALFILGSLLSYWRLRIAEGVIAWKEVGATA